MTRPPAAREDAPTDPVAVGPLNGLADIEGLRVGHAAAEDRPTGVTIVLCDALTPASVDVRGGGPATRETDLLRHGASVGAAHAILLSGGSVFGLAAADAAARRLSSQGVGLIPTPGAPPVPIAPAACLYDLPLAAAEGWSESGPPYARLAEAALDNAKKDGRAAPRLGAVGAGRGARAGAYPGGLGEASLDLGGGLVVAALTAANPVGSPYMSDGRSFWAWPLERAWRGAPEFGGARPVAETSAPAPPHPNDAKLPADAATLLQAAPATRAPLSLNTALSIVATNAPLTSAELHRVAVMAHDGFARAVRPAHTPFDGDTVFALGTGRGPTPPAAKRLALVGLIGAAASDCLARALCRGVHAADPRA
ncbi:MAG: P1 family peptidase [Pseudomonadota bacterium]